MFAIGYLQQTVSSTGWWLYVVLGLLLLIVIAWWLSSRRRGEQMEAAPEAYIQPKEQKPADDLVKIEGIGPKVAKVLNEAGITTFEALARANPAEVQKILHGAGLQMMNPEGWIEQAELAAKGDWEGLEHLQGALKGGRKR